MRARAIPAAGSEEMAAGEEKGAVERPSCAECGMVHPVGVRACVEVP